ncbi:hypothetical protein [Scatolibacter rhodanostii]|uniref:hypothetical protein n=1 Tax=Scatolibacter rhodanostii TaxID=2014781 RepID=UPI000C08BE04|nr:hypothetical protein [Scatolibacter rhodanostii]
MEKAREYLFDKTRPVGAYSSVHYDKSTRFDKAKEQANLITCSTQKIIDYTNEFLQLLGMQPVLSPKVERQLFNTDLYTAIKDLNGLKDKRDIVWMKFTTDGFLGAVATSDDINFQMPNDLSDYNKKTAEDKWRYNTSGIIIHHLKKKWDESFALVFPLQNIPTGLKRGDIERGIGNYLIKNKVPILDFFSHRY